MSEVPIYTVEQHFGRAFVPRVLTLLSLSVIFYVAVLLNIALLELDAEQETVTKIIALLFTIALLIVGIFFAYRQAKLLYLFFKDRITFGRDSLAYLDIHITLPGSTVWDKACKTYYIPCEKHFMIRNISQDLQLQQYLEQLVEYAKRNASQ